MKPSDFSRLFGVSIETLRNYETQGILNPVRVKNARSYTAGDLLSTILLLRLKRFGMHYVKWSPGDGQNYDSSGLHPGDLFMSLKDT